tara:strand:+ start:84 stop:224 length:141 start_codon:yes stop_codon:yes gene_type:complete
MGNVCCAPPKENAEDTSRGRGPIDITKLDIARKAKDEGNYGTHSYS